MSPPVASDHCHICSLHRGGGHGGDLFRDLLAVTGSLGQDMGLRRMARATPV